MEIPESLSQPLVFRRVLVRDPFEESVDFRSYDCVATAQHATMPFLTEISHKMTAWLWNLMGSLAQELSDFEKEVLAKLQPCTLQGCTGKPSRL
ncbi:hypothetical protein VI817_007511 [Penicillium citrinum]|nr:hypothetical protein VI817_007511 [Penicillium citrinum]